MFIIASEQTRELERLRKLLDKLGQPYRVFVTNLETDIAEQTESLASSRIMGMLDTRDHNLSF